MIELVLASATKSRHSKSIAKAPRIFTGPRSILKRNDQAKSCLSSCFNAHRARGRQPLGSSPSPLVYASISRESTEHRAPPTAPKHYLTTTKLSQQERKRTNQPTTRNKKDRNRVQSRFLNSWACGKYRKLTIRRVQPQLLRLSFIFRRNHPPYRATPLASCKHGEPANEPRELDANLSISLKCITFYISRACTARVFYVKLYNLLDTRLLKSRAWRLNDLVMSETRTAERTSISAEIFTLLHVCKTFF